MALYTIMACLLTFSELKQQQIKNHVKIKGSNLKGVKRNYR